MNYLALNSTVMILETVAADDGRMTWYNIVKTVDQQDGAERIPPTYHVLKELTAQGYLRTDPPEGGNDARYFLTDAGGRVLAARQVKA